MVIRFFCPFGHRLKVPEERAGKRGRCPVCRQRFIVPQFAMPATKTSRKGPWASSESSAAVSPPSEQPEPPGKSLIAAADATEPSKPEEQLEAVASPPRLEVEVPASASAPSWAPPSLEVGDARVAEAIAPSVTYSVPASLVPPPLPAASSNDALSYMPSGRSIGGSRRRIAWATWARGDERESFDVARSTPRQLEMVYWLACILPFAAIFSAAPAVPHLQFVGAPFWAQALLGLACLQFVYAAWLATVTDWSAVRVGMYLLAGITSVELLAALTLPFLPDVFLSSAGLSGARGTATAWCILAVVVNGLSCAACRWLQQRWRAGQI